MKKTLLKSTSQVASLTMVSRILGFIRDMVIAQFFGASLGADAFFVAYKIPNFMRRLFAEGAFSQAFVPMLSDYRQTKSLDEVRAFLGHIIGMLGTILLVVSLVGMFAAPAFIAVFAPGFWDDPERFALATRFLRIVFPYIFFISLTACFGAILNCYERFAVPAFTPVFLNLCLIGSAFFLAPRLQVPVESLAWGVLLAGVVQCAFQLPFVRAQKLLPKPRLSRRDAGVNTVLKRMVPALFGVSVAQINLMIDTVFASFLPIGSVSWLYYSDRLMQLPLGVFGVAVATVLLPALSRHFSGKNETAFSGSLDWALRVLLLIGLPSMLGLMFLAGPLLTTLFQYGHFSANDVLQARSSLIAFALGLQFLMLIKVLAAGFYARKNIRTPVKIAAVALIANLIFNAALIVPLAHAGIALATSLSGILNASLLAWGLYSHGIWQPAKGWSVMGLRLCMANALMAVWLYLGTNPLADWLSWHGLSRAAHLGGLIAVGIGIYFGVLVLSGLRMRDLRI